MSLKLVLEDARKNHIEEICNLVNLAYRGEIGWTKETGLVSGNRTSAKEVQKYMEDPNAHFLVAIENGEVISCICIEKKENSAYIGMFAVHPRLQGKGIGKEILSQAEIYAYTKLEAKKFVMAVVSQRNELISFYERSGYIRTGNIQEYPAHLDVGVPLVGGLTIEYLEKNS